MQKKTVSYALRFFTLLYLLITVSCSMPNKDQLNKDRVMALLTSTAWETMPGAGSSYNRMTYHSPSEATEEIFEPGGKLNRTINHTINAEEFGFDKKTGKPYLFLSSTSSKQAKTHLIYFAEGSSTSLGERQHWNAKKDDEGNIIEESGILLIKKQLSPE